MTGRGAEQPVGVDSQVRARVEESPFESLTRELFARDWDMSLDRKNEAFITAFENENEKWELQVNFDDEADYLVSSRSRWSIDKEEIGVVSQALSRMNSELMIDTFGSEIGVNEDLFCFEVKTRSELPEKDAVKSFFNSVEENTGLYGRWSDTVREASGNMEGLREIKKLEDQLSAAGEQDRELENRLRVMSEAFIRRIEEEDVMKTE
jgi:hypothetical protein